MHVVHGSGSKHDGNPIVCIHNEAGNEHVTVSFLLPFFLGTLTELLLDCGLSATYLPYASRRRDMLTWLNLEM